MCHRRGDGWPFFACRLRSRPHTNCRACGIGISLKCTRGCFAWCVPSHRPGSDGEARQENFPIPSAEDFLYFSLVRLSLVRRLEEDAEAEAQPGESLRLSDALTQHELLWVGLVRRRFNGNQTVEHLDWVDWKQLSLQLAQWARTSNVMRSAHWLTFC